MEITLKKARILYLQHGLDYDIFRTTRHTQKLIEIEGARTMKEDEIPTMWKEVTGWKSEIVIEKMRELEDR